jgi:hypothetical protein
MILKCVFNHSGPQLFDKKLTSAYCKGSSDKALSFILAFLRVGGNGLNSNADTCTVPHAQFKGNNELTVVVTGTLAEFPVLCMAVIVTWW